MMVPSRPSTDMEHSAVKGSIPIEAGGTAYLLLTDCCWARVRPIGPRYP
jgi:hypothetical protein